MENLEFLNLEFLDDSLKQYFYFVLSMVLGLILIIPVKSVIIKLLFKFFGKNNSDNDTKKFKSLLSKPLQYFLILIVLFFSSKFINAADFAILNDNNSFKFKTYITKAFNLFLLTTIFWVIIRSIDFIGYKLKNKALETESKVDDQLIPFAVDLAKVISVVLGAVMILGDVFDVNITALVTGLGIGGVAFALASKESLENLLGSFTIFFDKPFTVGDIVTLGGVTGIVEKVGFRSTRIRTFDKSIVTVPNKNIISSELDNLGARPVRRVKFSIGLIYDTPIEKIKAIVNDIQALVDKHEMTNQEGRVKFLNFGPSSLDIMVLYYVDSPEWEVLIETQQKINFSIIEIVNKHKCEFAFPSRSIYIEKK
ncbi:MAG: mechanosensitive ion channel protein MscS [Flavobacteriaceae bacterium]|nr:mechanosensitive ion channel protein MscS [Flavobacteriaceae bacterium]|tara:strand:- start:15751 stop:16851 length:1101 start_codon:yes stop_codon:yes gene_type:complete